MSAYEFAFYAAVVGGFLLGYGAHGFFDELSKVRKKNAMDGVTMPKAPDAPPEARCRCYCRDDRQA